jgi:hypothetical protein
VLGDGVEYLFFAPLVQGLELGQGPGEVQGGEFLHVLQVAPQLLYLRLQRAGTDLRHGQRG